MAEAIVGIATLGEAGGAYEQYNAEQSQEAALQEQSQVAELQTQQKTIANYDVLSRTLDAQEAQETTRGVKFDSPSFNAIQRNTLNKGATNQENINLEGDIAQQNIKTEKTNTRNKLYGELFGDLDSTALGLASIYSKMPTWGSADVNSGSASASDEEDEDSEDK